MKYLLAIVVLLGVQIVLAQQGSRIELNNIEVLSEKKQFLTLKMDLINTGNTDIVLPGAAECSVQFIEALSEKLAPYKKNIEQAILNEKLILSAGSSKSWTIKVNKQLLPEVGLKPVLPAYKVDLAGCADLLIADYKIVKTTGSYLWVEFTIVNRGKKTANLFGADPQKVIDNVTIKSILSTSSEVSSVFWETGSLYIDKGMKLRNGLLNPQESYTDLLKVDLSGQNKFTNYIILQVDPYLVIDDCNRANNNLTIRFK